MLARYSDAPESAYPDMDVTQRNKIMHGHVMLTETGGVSGAELVLNPPPHDNGISGMVKDKFGFVWVLSAELS